MANEFRPPLYAGATVVLAPTLRHGVKREVVVADPNSFNEKTDGWLGGVAAQKSYPFGDLYAGHLGSAGAPFMDLGYIDEEWLYSYDCNTGKGIYDLGEPVTTNPPLDSKPRQPSFYTRYK